MTELTKEHAAQTPLNDLVSDAIARMKAGAHMTLSDIPGDASLSTSNHPGDVSAAIATIALEALGKADALPPDLAAIAARNEARTQGKWEADRKFVVGTRSADEDQTYGMLVCHADVYGPKKEEDAAFIAHASEDIPSLLAEVARLTAELAEAEKRIAEAACNVVDAYSEFDQPYCCDGRMCGCQGQSVHDMMKHFIRAMVRQ